jgi:hypothetical protein
MVYSFEREGYQMTIHDRALEIAGRFKKSSTDTINIIQEIDDKRAYLEKGFTSTFDYCVKFLGLSDNTSLDFISIARKSKIVPELKLAIEKEEITISNARRITSVINKSNSSHWIGLAQSLSKDKLQKEIVKVNPQAATIEKAKYVTEDRIKLELGVSEEFMKDLKRVQEILSQKNKAHSNYEATLGKVLKEFVRRHDPIKKAQRAIEKTIPATTKVPAQLGPGRVRQPFNNQIKHQLHLRDNFQCTFIYSTGERCSQRKWLQIHHIKHVSQGGTNHIENLRTLCFGHHKMEHMTTNPIPGVFS